ncbi:sugar ABC transporter substrate-binding protein [Brachybacterium endophyticum]|uniref:Sugar ABC transporter substrate-binding protein n=1 Tax=Brachybacterium endophyticum TaxID=2182385 RepID=A0A2U2RNT9_9MICO|nr:sugar ABC transporter substrate-binding protein [Brachybacterium endophyticum]PWH07501.1 sugar ABC transporter substrate-binding protein [Brachybacterium endophyticum]
MTSRRALLGLGGLAGLSGAAALAGCSSDPQVDPALGEPATKDTRAAITYQIWDEAQAPAMQQIIDAFGEQYPGIDVTLTVTAYNSYFERLRIQATGDDLPDVFWMNGPNFELYASYGKLQDLTELEGFDPANYPENLVDLYTYEGARYAIPKDFDTIGLWYNRELLHRAGVDEPDGSWSWQQYRDASEQVTRKLAADRIWGNPGGVDTQAYVYPLALQAGGFIISKDGTTSGYDDPGTIEAFSFLRGMIEDGIAPDVRYTTENRPQDLFADGRAALLPSGTWQAAILQDSSVKKQLDVAPLLHGKQEGNVIHGIGNVMSARSAHKPAASAFLAFLGSKKAGRIQGAAGAANPAFIGANGAFLDALPDFDLSVFIDAAETAQPYPVSRNTSAWNQLEELLYPKVIGGPGAVEENAKDLADRMNGVLADES